MTTNEPSFLRDTLPHRQFKNPRAEALYQKWRVLDPNSAEANQLLIDYIEELLELTRGK